MRVSYCLIKNERSFEHFVGLGFMLIVRVLSWFIFTEKGQQVFFTFCLVFSGVYDCVRVRVGGGGVSE